ncbi:MAG: 23S rRNA (uracil(1939)-C(5))-methyltransferase RlmD [Firmicutes bacterium]|nr:23S rRNA (uracil(1939)-C(5))-methyltransferase RlmD [Bacillota bacterium]
MQLTKNKTITLDIIDLSFKGLGVAKHNGSTVFVHNAITGDKVKAKILAIKKQYAFAKVEEILIASKYRVNPSCKYFLKCGGCSLQHLSYEKELDFKKNLILQAFQKENITLPDIPFEIISSETEYQYRNKCSLPIRQGKSNKIEVGFFRKKSHDIIDIDECILQSVSIKELILELKNWMIANKILPYCEQTHTGNLRHITLRILNDNITVCLVGKENINKNVFILFSHILNKIFNGNFSLFYNYNPNKTNVIYSKDFVFLAGKDEPIEIDGLKLKVHPAGFFQVNDFVREQLFNKVEELAKQTNSSTIIEAYAGQGVLASKLSKAKVADKFYAIEICNESITAGLEMVKLNNINNLQFIEGDCGVELGKLLKNLIGTPRCASPTIKQLDFVGDAHLGVPNNQNPLLILDPPRSGVCDNVITAIKTNPPPYIIYISCNQNSLARDISTLMPHYKITHITAFDMFSQTVNIEALIMLEKI